MRRVAVTAAALVLGGGFYLVLIDTVDLPELYAGAVLAAAALAVSLGQGLAETEIALPWLAGAGRVLIQVPGQIALLSWEAVAQLFARKRGWPPSPRSSCSPPWRTRCVTSTPSKGSSTGSCSCS